MASVLHLILLLLLLHTCTCDEIYYMSYCNNSKIINNTKISNNINQLLPKLVSQTSLHGFTFLSYGTGSNQVFGLAQCRKDVINTKECSTCISDAAKKIQTLCPNQADSRLLFDFCFLRYDIRNFYGELDTSNGVTYYNTENVAGDYEAFATTLGSLMDNVTAEALVKGNGGFGKGKVKLSPFVTLYGLVQCTRDLSQLLCGQCLATAIENFDTACKNRKGCRPEYTSCYVRYELYPIYFPFDSNETVANNTYSRAIALST